MSKILSIPFAASGEHDFYDDSKSGAKEDMVLKLYQMAFEVLLDRDEKNYKSEGGERDDMDAILSVMDGLIADDTNIGQNARALGVDMDYVESQFRVMDLGKLKSLQTPYIDKLPKQEELSFR